jgi:hypothetical protein
MQEHLGKFYVSICEYKYVFLISFNDHEILGFFKKVFIFTCTRLLMVIWPSSFYMFPKSTLSSCKVHLTIVLLGYFAKLTLPSYQIHF